MTYRHENRYGSISVVELPHVTLCLLSGEIDVALRPQAGAALQRMARREEPVVIDLSDVTFIDSSGLAFLVVSSQARQRAAARTTLNRPPASVVELLRLAGATDLFEITEVDLADVGRAVVQVPASDGVVSASVRSPLHHGLS